MSPLMERMRIFTAVLCFIATLSSFAVIVSHHQLGEESKEVVEFEECEEAITDQQKRRRKQKGKTLPRKFFRSTVTTGLLLYTRQLSLPSDSDRSFLNGSGCYLLI